MAYRLVSMVVRVPLDVCSLCGAEAPALVHEAESARICRLQGIRIEEEGVDLVTRSYQTAEGWRTVDLPGGRITACNLCGPELSRIVEESLEKIRGARSICRLCGQDCLTLEGLRVHPCPGKRRAPR